jgi:hypothetical protein
MPRRGIEVQRAAEQFVPDAHDSSAGAVSDLSQAPSLSLTFTKRFGWPRHPADFPSSQANRSEFHNSW